FRHARQSALAPRIARLARLRVAGTGCGTPGKTLVAQALSPAHPVQRGVPAILPSAAGPARYRPEQQTAGAAVAAASRRRDRPRRLPGLGWAAFAEDGRSARQPASTRRCHDPGPIEARLETE